MGNDLFFCPEYLFFWKGGKPIGGKFAFYFPFFYSRRILTFGVFSLLTALF